MTVRAVQLHAGEGALALRVLDIPEPERVPGEVRIRFEASTLNPADLKIRNGLIRPRQGEYPFTLGWDLIGRVLDGDGFAIGTRIAGMSAMAATGIGTWAEVVSLPRESLAQVDGDVDPAVLAQLPLTGLTALAAIDAAGASADHAVIVVGGNGAVGLTVLQILAHRGLKPRALLRDIAAASPALRALDVEIVDHAGYASADVIIDAAGTDLAAALRPGGVYVVVVPGSEPRELPGGALQRVIRGAPSGERTAELLALVAAGGIRLGDPARFALDDIDAAFSAYERRRSGSRIALVDALGSKGSGG